MGRSVYFPVTIAAVALLVGIAGSGMAGAVPDFEWSVPVVAYAGVEGSNADLELGIHPDATNGYDYGIDLPSPPPQPSALFEAYFSIVHTLFPRLNKDFRGEIPNEWTLKVRSTDEDIELSWNTDDVPQGVALRLVSAEADIDMKAVSSITLPAGAHTITVIAEQIEIGQHDLTISSTSGGSVTVPGEGAFAYGEGTVVSLVAEAEEGYRFVSWTGDVNTIADVEVSSTTITMQGDCSIMANFGIQPGQYNLTISSTSGGSVTVPGEGAFAYGEGTVVSLVAEAEEGYRFVSWTGDVNTIADVEVSSTTITMQGDCSIMANFGIQPGQYNLTISSTSGGSVTVPGEGAFAYDEGTVVSLVAGAEEDYRFVSWIGDVETIADVEAASTTITMQGDYIITANFATPQVQYDLTISSTSGGSVTEPGEGAFTYDKGMVVSLIAEAEEGYRFVSWTGDVNTIADVEVASTTITMQGDYFITANFGIQPGQYNLTISSTSGGSVITPGEGTFTYDPKMVVNLVAELEEGYRFVNWTGDVDTIVGVNAAATNITMDGDYSITTSFEEIPPPINWPLIGGVIAAVVAGGLGIFFFRRGRVV